MHDASAELAAADREVLLAARLEYERWAQEAQQQQHEAERWQRRIDLAECHQEFELATNAAQRARHHAGLALAAEEHVAGLKAQVRRRGPDTYANVLIERVRASASGVTSTLEDRFAFQETERDIEARLAAIKAANQAVVQQEGP